MSNDDDRRGYILWMVIGLLLSGIFGTAIAYAQMQECTRVHPLWYCVLQ